MLVSVAKQQEKQQTTAKTEPVCEEAVTEEIETVTMETEGSIGVEGEGEEGKTLHSQPMDLGSPLDSDPEFDLLPGDQDDSIVTKGSQRTDQAAAEEEKIDERGGEGATEEEEEEEKKEVKCDDKREARTTADKEGGERKRDGVTEAAAGSSSSGEKQKVERLDSTFDSSYEPSTEELLYEGDPEAENRQDASLGEEEGGGKLNESSASMDEEDPVKKEGNNGVPEGAAPREEEEGFMVEVHYKDQGGGLDDPATTATGPASSSTSEKKRSSDVKSAPAAASDSSRFVLSFCFSPLSPQEGSFLIGAHSTKIFLIEAHSIGCLS